MSGTSLDGVDGVLADFSLRTPKGSVPFSLRSTPKGSVPFSALHPKGVRPLSLRSTQRALPLFAALHQKGSIPFRCAPPKRGVRSLFAALHQWGPSPFAALHPEGSVPYSLHSTKGVRSLSLRSTRKGSVPFSAALFPKFVRRGRFGTLHPASRAPRGGPGSGPRKASLRPQLTFRAVYVSRQTPISRS